MIPAALDSLIERFCRYVRVDTQADETSSTYPSTPGQIELSRMLTSELKAIGLSDAAVDQYGIVMATIPSTVKSNAPVIAWVAHVDTSPETSGRGVKPVIHRAYAGGDLVLPGNRERVLSPSDIPELAGVAGHTLITSDGTTLLGADDKAGVAVIMETAAYLNAHPEIPHGSIRICFTCDEEVGHGVDHIDLKKLGAHVAYTLDGGGVGEIDVETFSADLAVVTVTGVNTHPSAGKGKMVNALRLAAALIERLPTTGLSPETTADREGFLHPYRIEGGVAEVTIRILLRDFETRRLSEQAELLEAAARRVMSDHPRSKIEVKITPQYRNMADGLAREPRAVQLAGDAMRAAGVAPRRTIVRGGTDGSRLTDLGLPTPNLSTGEHNIHSPLEWTSVEEMATAVRVLIELAKQWGSVR